MTSIRRTLVFALTALSFAVLGGCATTPAPTNVADTVARTPELSTLSRLIGDAGLTETLSGTGPYTVFAPSDQAFKAVPAKTLAEYAKDKDLLRSVLSYHVVAGKMLAADAKTGPVKSVQGASLTLARAGTFLTVEDAVVEQPDVAATNGVIHVIDRMLVPPKK
jgi:uncharacterized surface protein with fasciclin (FAS1) repeats